MKTDQPIKRNPFRFLLPALAVLMAASLASCLPEKSDASNPTPAKDETATPKPSDSELRLLTEQVERERELRGEAETRVASESGRREFWATLTVVTGMLAVALFLVGTAIGSKGRRHAESA